VIRIVVVDGYAIVRHGVKRVFEAESDFQVVGETGDGLEGISMAGSLRPDVMIVDMMLPGVNGIEITRQVARSHTHTKVVIYSMHEHEQYVYEAMAAGAMGFVLKSSDSQDLIVAVRQVVAGHHYLSGPLADIAVDTFVKSGPAKKKDPCDSLTPREMEILRLAAEGFTNREIAARLCISHRTVELHRSNLIRKLGLRVPHIGLGRYAVERGLVPNLAADDNSFREPARLSDGRAGLVAPSTAEAAGTTS